MQHSGPVDVDLETFFREDHRACDALWSELESAVDAGDDARARSLWERFDARMRRHLAMEEEVLFPAFEQASGMMGGGPTAVMRMEHEQMRGVLAEMGRAAQGGDFEAVADHGDTLLMLIQQHNAKEEGVLYPMASQVLGGQWAALAQQLARYGDQ